MATRKSIDTRRKIAGKILHISRPEGLKKTAIKDAGAYVPLDDYLELLTDSKRLAGSILSSKQEKPSFARRLFGRE